MHALIVYPGEIVSQSLGSSERLSLENSLLNRQILLLRDVGVESITLIDPPECIRTVGTNISVVLTGSTNYASTLSKLVGATCLVLYARAVFDGDLLHALVQDPRSHLAVRSIRDSDGSLAHPIVKAFGIRDTSRISELIQLTASIRETPAHPDLLEGFDTFESPESFLELICDVGDVGRIAEHVSRFDLAQQSPLWESNLAPSVHELGIQRALLVCDRTYDTVELALRLAAPALQVIRFVRPTSEVDTQSIRHAYQTYQEGQCDGIIAIGGRDIRDFALSLKMHSSDAELDNPTRKNPAVPLIFVPVGTSATFRSIDFSPAERSLPALLTSARAFDRVILFPTANRYLTGHERGVFALGVLCDCVDAILSNGATAESTGIALSALDVVTRTFFTFVKGDDELALRKLVAAANDATRAGELAQSSALMQLGRLLGRETGISTSEASALCLAPLLRAYRDHSAVTPDIELKKAIGSRISVVRRALGTRSLDRAIERIQRILAFVGVEPPVAPHLNVDAMVLDAHASLWSSALAPLSHSDMATLFENALSRSTTLQDADDSLTAEFEVLKRFAKFCSQYRVRYYLHGETLRDAVVHGRLTPWNRQVSVALPRSAFNKLVALRDRLPEGLELDDFASQPSRKTLLPRIVDVVSLSARPGGADFSQRPGVVIHVLEGLTHSYMKRCVQFAALRLLYEGYGAALDRTLRSRNTLRQLIRRLAHALPYSVLNDATRLVAKLGSSVDSYVDLGARRRFAKAQFPASWFRGGRIEQLQGIDFMVPIRAGSVLARTFGRQYSSVKLMAAPRTIRAVECTESAPIQAPGSRHHLPFISVILPVYNVERYLIACLDALCYQQYENFEIVAVNDGSTDGSVGILREYASRYPHLVRVLHKPNGGLSDARNHGIERARGEYVVFVDSDDVVSPRMLQLFAEKCSETQADIVVCGISDYRDDSNQATPQHMGWKQSYGHSVRDRTELLLAAHTYACNKIYRKSLFTDTDIRYPVGQAFEDSATTYNLLLEANKVELVDEPLYFYRRDNPDSITNSADRRFFDIFKSFDSFRGYYQGKGVYSEFRQELQEVARRIVSARLQRLESNSNLDFVMEFIDAVFDYLDTHEPGWNRNRYFERVLASPKHAKNRRYLALSSRDSAKDYFGGLHEARKITDRGAAPVSTRELGRMLQRETLEVLLTIDAFCRAHSITYYLAEGTLLGAVRHQGFIPWDDDVDICIPRADYDRFVRLLAAQAFPGLTLYNEETYPKYHLTFTKVLNSKPSNFITSAVPVPREFSGPAVDVFPLDVAAARDSKAHAYAIRWLRDALLFKVGYLTLTHARKRIARLIASRILGFGFLRKSIRHLYLINSRTVSRVYLANYASSYPLAREKFRAEWFSKPVRVPFEGHKLPVPSNAHAVLAKTYGDYLVPPSMSRRTFRHRPLWRGNQAGPNTSLESSRHSTHRSGAT